MRELLLMRHGKAADFTDSSTDFDRPLAAAGRDQAERAGRWLQQQGRIPDLIIASPALRTRQTAERVAEVVELLGPVELAPSLYNAPAGRLIEVLEQAEAERVMLVGHNPGISHCWQIITGRPDNFHTASLGVARMPEDCRQLADGCGVAQLPVQHFPA